MKYLFTFLFLSLLFKAPAIIVEAPHIDVIEKEIQTLNEDSLVVLDVDLTIIVPKDKVLTPSGRNFYTQKKAEIVELFGQDKLNQLVSIVLLNQKVQLINPKILQILSYLKAKNIKVIALTAARSGPYGVIPSIEDWRLNQLDALGIHFRDAFPHFENCILEKCVGEKCPAVFKDGILFSGKYPKGAVLGAFLEKIQKKPSKIIFVDDLLEYIETVESYCQKENIPSISFHYTEATLASSGFDLEIAKCQFEHLCNHEVWLTDEEAKERIGCLTGSPSR